MRLAITGGAGFLGYHIANQLASRYDEILVLDITPVDLKEYPSNARYIKTDVRDRRALADIFKNVDIVVHGAAALPLWKRKDIFDINVGGTRNVLDAALAAKIKRVVFVSSTAVYGVPKKHPLFEDDPLVGVGPYGESKIAAEMVCQSYRDRLCVPVVRPKTFIGSGRMGVFQILYDWVESGVKIPVIGNGKNRYQLLAVEDLVDAIYLLLSGDEQKSNDTFNVGAAVFATVSEDVSQLCRFSGSGSRVMPTSAGMVVFFLAVAEAMKLSPLYKWVYGTAAQDSFVSIDKIKNNFGFQPRYSNAQALINSYKWYQEHKVQLSRETGITHRVAWKQGVLALIKKIL